MDLNAKIRNKISWKCGLGEVIHWKRRGRRSGQAATIDNVTELFGDGVEDNQIFHDKFVHLSTLGKILLTNSTYNIRFLCGRYVKFELNSHFFVEDM